MLTNKLYTKSSENMSEVDDRSIELVVTSPPYNTAVEYGNLHKNGRAVSSKGYKYFDKRPEEEYRTLLKKVFSESKRVLKEDGSIWVNIKNRYIENRIVPPFWLEGMFTDMFLKNIIIWNFDWGGSTERRFSPRFEYIFWYTMKPNDYVFNLEEVKIPALNYRPDRFKSQFKNPSDVWYIQMVSGNYPERTSHPAQYPEELIERIIKVASNPNDIVLDPFVGSGTTARVAKNLDRRYIGYDTSQEYIDIAEKRLALPVTYKKKKSKDVRDLYWYLENDELSQHVKLHTSK